MKAETVTATKAENAKVSEKHAVAQPIGSMKVVAARARAITSSELRRSLIEAGILRPNGELAAAYSLPSKKKDLAKAGAADIPSKSKK